MAGFVQQVHSKPASYKQATELARETDHKYDIQKHVLWKVERESSSDDRHE